MRLYDELLRLGDMETDECVEWTGNLTSSGYVRVYPTGETKAVMGHRRLLELNIGRTLEQKEFACHHCDNRKCLNVRHLFIGSNDDNMKDMARKGRANKPIGTTNGRCKLSEQDVRNIKETYLSGGTTLQELATKYGVSFGLIGHIVKGRKWTHL